MLNITFDMLQSLKPFICPSCNFNFTSRDVSRVHAVPRFPLILKCRHTVCENCLKGALRIQQKFTCAVCQECTEFANGDSSKLIPDVYALGIVSANMKQVLPSLKMKLTPPNQATTKTRARDKAVVICEHCSVVEADFRCNKCEEYFCNACFDDFHKSHKHLKKHIGIPVYSCGYTSAVQGGCPEHENRVVEFFCEEDNDLVCSLCVVTGSHKGHAVMTLLDKNKLCIEDLCKAREEATLVNRRLRLTEQKLTQVIPNEKVDNSQYVKLIHDYFHGLHSALIARESEMILQLETISQANVTQIEKLQEEVSHSYRDLEAVLRDAELVMQNPMLSVSIPCIIKNLRSAKDLPCHLVPVASEGSDEKLISLDFDPPLIEDILKHGRIIADIKPKFNLMTEANLPSDFSVDPLPVETPAADTESATSDSFSEDSLSSSPSQSQPNLPTPASFQMAARQEKVHVTHIRDPTHFYIMRSSESRKLKTVLDKIGQWCRSTAASKHVPNSIKEGDLYLVQFSEDNKWYRGRARHLILTDDEKLKNGYEPRENSDIIDSKTKVEVFYIDFGNAEIVPLSRIRNMQTQFLNLPGMAKLCSLYDIVPVNNVWTNEAVDVFSKFVRDKEINMLIMEECANVLHVDLSQSPTRDIVNDTPVSVRDALVFLEHACFIAKDKPVKAKRKRHVGQYYPPEELRANTKATVLVSHVESPSSFYVQQLSSSRHLSDLILEMKKVYGEETNMAHAIYAPYVGMLCAAKFKKDDFWYRAEIIGLPGGATVEIQYTDFGNRDRLPHQHIRKLLDQFAKLCTQAVRCTLADVTYPNGKGWTPEAASWLAGYVEKKHLTLLSLGMTAGSKVTKAVLYITQEDAEICVNADLAEQSFAISSGSYSKTKTLLRKKSGDSATCRPQSASSPKKSTTPPRLPVVLLPEKESDAVVLPSLVAKDEPPNHVKVHVSHIETPGRFFVRIANDTEANYVSLMQDIQKEYDGMEVPMTINIGSSYACFCDADKKWHRSIVIQQRSDVSYQVRFVDVGLAEDVPSKHFRALLPKHSTDQAYAIQCHLVDVTPAGDSSKWSRLAIDTFKDLVEPHNVLCLTGEEQVVDNSLPADLVYEEIIRGGALEPSRIDFCSIKEKLIERGAALPTRKSRVRVPVDEGNNSPCSTLCNSPNDSNVSSPVKIIPPPTEKPASMKLLLPRKLTFQWTPVEMPSTLKFSCVPTHVDDSGCIYVQAKPEATGKVELITNALGYKFADPYCERLRILPAVGEAIIARFDLDKKLYRAELISDDINKIKVQFVDYGNCEIVELQDMYMGTYFKEIPRLALECELHDTKPVQGKTWSSNVLNFLHENIVDRDCSAEIIVMPNKNQRMQVTLCLEDVKTDVSDLLKEIGFAVSSSEYESRLVLDKIEQDLMGKTNGEIVRYKKASDLKLNEPFKVCITQLLEPNIVCLQRLKIEAPQSEVDESSNAEIDQFLRLSEELNEKGESFPKVHQAEKGLACCAKYSYDNNWYRCEVTNVNEEEVRVYYVDYGNAELLPQEKLRKPDSSFLDFPIQAHVCKIRGLAPAGSEWSTEATEALIQKLFHSPAVYARLIEASDISIVELLNKTEDGDFKLIYQDIINDGLMKFLPS